MTIATTYERCRHFRGIQHATCLAGVRMRDVSHPIPCLQLIGRKVAPDTCPQRQFMTAEEHAAEAREMDAAFDRLRRLGAAGLCHVCEQPTEPSRIVGKCRYGACGHRIGRVR